MTLNGKVMWFNPTKGYGFISRDDDAKDVFVHSSAVKTAGLSGLAEGETLTVEVEAGAKAPPQLIFKKVKRRSE